MKYILGKNIKILGLGIVAGVIALITEQYSIQSMGWRYSLLFSGLAALSVTIFVSFMRVLPVTENIKYLFSVKYFKYVSIFIVGSGLVLLPALLKNGENIATSAFIILFGFGALAGSFISKIIISKGQ